MIYHGPLIKRTPLRRGTGISRLFSVSLPRCLCHTPTRVIVANARGRINEDRATTSWNRGGEGNTWTMPAHPRVRAPETRTTSNALCQERRFALLALISFVFFHRSSFPNFHLPGLWVVSGRVMAVAVAGLSTLQPPLCMIDCLGCRRPYLGDIVISQR